MGCGASSGVTPPEEGRQGHESVEESNQFPARKSKSVSLFHFTARYLLQVTGSDFGKRNR